MNMMSRIAAGTALTTISAPAMATFDIIGSPLDQDPDWSRLVAKYRSVRDERERLYALYEEADERFLAAPKPEAPVGVEARLAPIWNPDGSMNEPVLQDLMRDVRAYRDRREGAFAEYEREHAAWKAECEALREKIEGEAERAWDAACDRTYAAIREIVTYPVRSLQHLSEKVALIMEEFGEDAGNGKELHHVANDVQRLSLLS